MELDAQGVDQAGDGVLERTLKKISAKEKVQRQKWKELGRKSAEDTVMETKGRVSGRNWSTVSTLPRDQIAQELSCEH